MSKIKQMEIENRPREKAIAFGITALKNEELLAILLRTGTKEKSAIELGKEVLSLSEHLSMLTGLSIEDLMKIKGIKAAKALQLIACFELSRRMSFEKIEECISIEHPQHLVDWLNKEIGSLAQEHFLVIFLDNRNRIRSYETLFKGTLNSSVVHPREVFKKALTKGCASIICVHNHPSGDCEPSEADIQLTKCIAETGKLVGIPLLDHLIVGGNNYVSLRQKLLFD